MYTIQTRDSTYDCIAASARIAVVAAPLLRLRVAKVRAQGGVRALRLVEKTVHLQYSLMEA